MKNVERITILTRSSSLDVEIDAPPSYQEAVSLTSEEVASSN
ncbi:7538_t:CDS:2, partial [Dentiscutata heterogama]